MKLLLDAGNSRLKWATLEHGELTPGGAISYATQPVAKAGDRLADAWAALPVPTSIVLCSVAPAAFTHSVIQWCHRRWSCPIHSVRSQARAHGVTNAYPRPETLGNDRWAALIGTHRHYHGNKCIIDAGTAVTIDLIDAGGHHTGGLIAPGYQSMLHALQSTTRLNIPSHANAPMELSPGNNTADCIHAGVLYSLVGLIEQAARQFADGDNRVILTGGNAGMLRPVLSLHPIHDPDLVFSGLSVIAESQQ
jgi:type III pantothenate kinase